MSRPRTFEWVRTRWGGTYRRMLLDVGDDPGWYATAAVATVAVVTLAIHFVQWFTLGSAAPFNWLGLTPGVVLTALLITLLVRHYWHVRLEGRTRDPYVIVFATSAAVLGICTAAFSGLTTLLWRQGFVTAMGESEPGLWAVERYYIWHLADAMPLIELPQTLRWEEPLVLEGPWAVATLLAFKVVVIIPLLRVAVSSYGLALDGLVNLSVKIHNRRKDDDSGQRRVDAVYTTSARDAWIAAVGLMITTVLAVVLLHMTVAPSSWLHNATTSRYPDGFVVFGHSLSLNVILDVLDVALAIGGIFLIGSILLLLGEAFAYGMDFDSHWARFGTVTAAICTLGPAIVVASAATIALVHVGWAGTSPELPASAEVTAAFNWYAWHLADMIPVLEITDTLNWNLAYDFTDGWTATLLLLAKLLFLAVLAWPIALVVRMAISSAKGRRPQSRLLDDVNGVQSSINESVSLVERAEDKAMVAHPDSWVVHDAITDARRAVRSVDPAIERIRSLFGSGVVTEAAEDVVATLVVRLTELDPFRWTRFHRQVVTRTGASSAATAAATQEIVDAIHRRRSLTAERITRLDARISDALADVAAPTRTVPEPAE